MCQRFTVFLKKWCNIKNLKIKDVLFNKIILFLNFLIIFLSTCYINIPIISKFLFILSMILSSILIVLYTLNFKFNCFSILYFMFLFLLFWASFISDSASILLFFKNFLKISAVALYLNWGINVNYKNTINSIYYALYVMIMINFATIIIFPTGMYSGSYNNNWFLGYDNTHIFWFVSAIAMGVVKKKLIHNNNFQSILFVLLLLIISYSVLFCFSANSVIGYIIIIIYLLFFKFLKNKKYLNSKNYFIVTFLTFFSIVIFRVQNVFSWLIVGILKKDLTFTNRTTVWDNAIKWIIKKPLLGSGIESNEIVISKLNGVHFVHAHDTYLDVLYKGGILSMIPFLLLIFFASKKLYEYKDYNVIKVLSIILFSCLIMMIFESREFSFGLYIILVLAFNCDILIKSGEKNE